MKERLRRLREDFPDVDVDIESHADLPDGVLEQLKVPICLEKFK